MNAVASGCRIGGPNGRGLDIGEAVVARSLDLLESHRALSLQRGALGTAAADERRMARLREGRFRTIQTGKVQA